MSRAKCRNCGEPIEFRPHPNNPAKLAPFNSDGEIHFATCSKRGRAKKEYNSLSDIRCHCGHVIDYCFMRPIEGRKQLYIACHNKYRHLVALAHTEKNLKLINVPEGEVPELLSWIEDEHKELYRRYWGASESVY